MESVLWLTPDSDRKTLVQLQRFAHRLRVGNRAALTVPALGLDLEIAPDATEGQWQRVHPLDALLVEARVASRLGHDGEAIALCSLALEQEIDRGATYQQLILISARAERFDLTQQIIGRLSASVHRDGAEASRQLLLRRLPPDQVHERLSTWSMAMGGWTDAP